MNSAYSCCLSSGFFVFVSRLPTKSVGDGVAKAILLDCWMVVLMGPQDVRTRGRRWSPKSTLSWSRDGGEGWLIRASTLLSGDEVTSVRRPPPARSSHGRGTTLMHEHSVDVRRRGLSPLCTDSGRWRGQGTEPISCAGLSRASCASCAAKGTGTAVVVAPVTLQHNVTRRRTTRSETSAVKCVTLQNP